MKEKSTNSDINDLSDLAVIELKYFLRAYELPISDNKPELMLRLQTFLKTLHPSSDFDAIDDEIFDDKADA